MYSILVRFRGGRHLPFYVSFDFFCNSKFEKQSNSSHNRNNFSFFLVVWKFSQFLRRVRTYIFFWFEDGSVKLGVGRAVLRDKFKKQQNKGVGGEQTSEKRSSSLFNSIPFHFPLWQKNGKQPSSSIPYIFHEMELKWNRKGMENNWKKQILSGI